MQCGGCIQREMGPTTMSEHQQFGDSSSLMEKTQKERNRKGLTGDITPQGKNEKPKTINKPST
jgi:hypothetical protein